MGSCIGYCKLWRCPTASEVDGGAFPATGWGWDVRWGDHDGMIVNLSLDQIRAFVEGADPGRNPRPCPPTPAE